jgi:hypothetical protein
VVRPKKEIPSWSEVCGATPKATTQQKLQIMCGKVLKMLGEHLPDDSPPSKWETFDPDNQDDQDRLTRWLEKQVFLGRTADDIARDIGVDPLIVNKLINNRIKQDRLNALFAVAQNMAKAQVLSNYPVIIPRLMEAMQKADEPKMIKEIADTIAKFADLKPPDPKLMVQQFGDDQDQSKIEDFRLLEEIIGSKVGGGSGQSEDSQELVEPPKTDGVPSTGDSIM